MTAVKLTKYEFFEQGYGQLAVNIGLISPSVFMQFIHYKLYLEQLEDGHNKCTAIQITADITHCSFSTVYRSVQYFLKM